MERTFMVHISLHWTYRGDDALLMWSFIVKQSVWLYNRLPKKELVLTPLEIFQD